MSIPYNNVGELFELAEKDFKQYADLPIPVYITERENGIFIAFNDAAKTLFNLSDSERGVKSIADFYCDINQRNYIINRLEKTLIASKQTANILWEKNTLEFFINSKKQSLRFYAKPYSLSSGKLGGSLSLAFPITEIERFEALEDILPIGIFDININNEISYSNAYFKKLFALSDATSTTPISAKTLLSNEELYTRNKIEIERDKPDIYEKKLLFKKFNGKRFIGALKLVPEFTKEENLLKSKGFVYDATFEDIIYDAPVGLYLILDQNGEEIIVKANKYFAEINGFKTREECEGVKVKDLHLSEEAYENFKSEIREKDRKHLIVSDHYLEIKTRDGFTKEVLVTLQQVKDENENPIGRIGFIVDITSNVENKLKNYKHDFAGFLHNYANMLISMRDTINSIIEGHGTNIFENKKVNIEKAFQLINDHKERLKSAVLSLKVVADKIGIHFSTDKIIAYLKSFNLKEISATKENAAWIRAITKKIRNSFRDQLVDKRFNKEAIKSVEREITAILRYAKLISLSVLTEEITNFTIEINTFKATLSDDLSVKNPYTNFDLIKLLNSVITNLTEYSYSRTLTINTKYYNTIELSYTGDYRKLYNAFYNILHNAIKYSRKYDDKKKELYIQVRVINQIDSILVEIENTGVPIRKREVDENLIYTFGFRGASSIEEGRKGSGIGLWYAKTVIEEHKGAIKIESVNLAYNQPDDYSKPFLTTIQIKLTK